MKPSYVIIDTKDLPPPSRAYGDHLQGLMELTPGKSALFDAESSEAQLILQNRLGNKIRTIRQATSWDYKTSKVRSADGVLQVAVQCVTVGNKVSRKKKLTKTVKATRPEPEGFDDDDDGD